MMHGREKSDPEIVAMKPTNNAVPTAAELVERRAGTKGNAGQQSTLRAQDRAGVSQALERIRQAARHSKKERFTALLHHVNPEMLRLAFNALKKDAAPGVDGVVWSDYEADLSLGSGNSATGFRGERIGLNRRAGCIFRRRTVGSVHSRSPQSRTKSSKARSRWC